MRSTSRLSQNSVPQTVMNYLISRRACPPRAHAQPRLWRNHAGRRRTTPPHGRARNRRVEIKIVPDKSGRCPLRHAAGNSTAGILIGDTKRARRKAGLRHCLARRHEDTKRSRSAAGEPTLCALQQRNSGSAGGCAAGLTSSSCLCGFVRSHALFNASQLFRPSGQSLATAALWMRGRCQTSTPKRARVGLCCKPSGLTEGIAHGGARPRARLRSAAPTSHS